MNRPTVYNSKKREAILSYIASLNGGHVTASQIIEHFESGEIPIDRTTVYLHIKTLTENGKIRRYVIDGISGACFQYVGKETVWQKIFHLKCECCGELIHLQCNALNEIKNHVLNEHDFEVNTMKTVLYGKCQGCLNSC